MSSPRCIMRRLGCKFSKARKVETLELLSEKSKGPRRMLLAPSAELYCSIRSELSVQLTRRLLLSFRSSDLANTPPRATNLVSMRPAATLNLSVRNHWKNRVSIVICPSPSPVGVGISGCKIKSGLQSIVEQIPANRATPLNRSEIPHLEIHHRWIQSPVADLHSEQCRAVLRHRLLIPGHQCPVHQVPRHPQAILHLPPDRIPGER